jgi:hypothetical protein
MTTQAEQTFLVNLVDTTINPPMTINLLADVGKWVAQDVCLTLNQGGWLRPGIEARIDADEEGEG